MDAEWQPYSTRPAATLVQLGCRFADGSTTVYLLDFCSLLPARRTPVRRLLQSVFRDPSVVVVGFGIEGDLRAIAAALGGEGAGCIAVMQAYVSIAAIHKHLLRRGKPVPGTAGSSLSSARHLICPDAVRSSSVASLRLFPFTTISSGPRSANLLPCAHRLGCPLSGPPAGQEPAMLDVAHSAPLKLSTAVCRDGCSRPAGLARPFCECCGTFHRAAAHGFRASKVGARRDVRRRLNHNDGSKAVQRVDRGRRVPLQAGFANRGHVANRSAKQCVGAVPDRNRAGCTRFDECNRRPRSRFGCCNGLLTSAATPSAMPSFICML